MLRARPINEVRARAERIQLLVFCGFGSRRIALAQLGVCKRDVCAARGRLLQPLAESCGFAARQAFRDGRQRSMRI